ncbi:hypothetical protein M758_9G111800 [Ceratodon purpureus]|nr:hypothetical protein M758_9G111800 [Ceratodon purpureus]
MPYLTSPQRSRQLLQSNNLVILERHIHKRNGDNRPQQAMRRHHRRPGAYQPGPRHPRRLAALRHKRMHNRPHPRQITSNKSPPQLAKPPSAPKTLQAPQFSNPTPRLLSEPRTPQCSELLPLCTKSEVVVSW